MRVDIRKVLIAFGLFDDEQSSDGDGPYRWYSWFARDLFIQSLVETREYGNGVVKVKTWSTVIKGDPHNGYIMHSTNYNPDRDMTNEFDSEDIQRRLLSILMGDFEIGIKYFRELGGSIENGLLRQ